MQYVGIDWAYRRAAWCAKQADGTISGEGFVPADEDGLARLVPVLHSDVFSLDGSMVEFPVQSRPSWS